MGLNQKGNCINHLNTLYTTRGGTIKRPMWCLQVLTWLVTEIISSSRLSGSTATTLGTSKFWISIIIPPPCLFLSVSDWISCLQWYSLGNLHAGQYFLNIMMILPSNQIVAGVQNKKGFRRWLVTCLSKLCICTNWFLLIYGVDDQCFLWERWTEQQNSEQRHMSQPVLSAPQLQSTEDTGCLLVCRDSYRNKSKNKWLNAIMSLPHIGGDN